MAPGMTFYTRVVQFIYTLRPLPANGSDTVNRAPNGARTPSMNRCLLRYSFDATECPSIRQTISGANTSVMAPVPTHRPGPRDPKT
jgi:hypothetical protein